MAQVQLDVLYDVKGLGALKQSQAVLNGSSNAAKGAAASAKKLGNAVGGVGGKATASAVGVKAFGSASKYASAGVKALGASIASTLGPIAAATAIIGAFGAGLKTISDVDFSAAKLRSLGVDAGKLGGELRGVTNELQGQASQAELMGAAYDVASAGFTDAADAASVLTAASKGATGGFSDLNTVANATTSVLNAYGKSASEAERLVDSFIQTQNDGKIVIGEYADNIAKVAPVAAGLGVELGEINAIIAQVTASGTKAEVAFTGLKTALAQLASGNANKALADIGVEITAADLASEGLIGVLQKIKDSGVDVGTAFKAFGNEAAPVLQAVFNDLEKTNQLLDNQKNSAGAAAAAQAQAANTIQGAWKAVGTAFSNLFADQSAFGEVIKVALQGLAFVITDIGNRLNLVLNPFKIFLQTIGLVVAKAKELGAAFMQGFAQSAQWQKIGAIFQVLQDWIGKAAGKLQEMLGPAFEAALDWAKQFGEYVGNQLWGAIDGLIQGLIKITSVIPGLKGLSKDMAEAWNGFKDAVENVNQELSKTEVKPDLQQQIKDLQIEADVLGKKLQSALSAENAQIGNALRLTQAKLGAEQAIVAAKKDAAAAELEAATTQEQRVAAAEKIYQASVQQADLTYEATKAALLAEESKLQAQARYLAGQVKIQELKLAEAKAAGEVTEAHRQAVEVARGALGIAVQNITAQEAVTDATLKGAAATRQQQLEQAKTVLEANKLNSALDGTVSKVNASADGAGRLAANLQAAASASQGISGGSFGGGGGGGGSGSGTKTYTHTYRWKNLERYKIGPDGDIVEKTKDELKRDYNQIRLGGWVGDIRYTNQGKPGGLARAFANGGYVTGPTNAVVGEGGEPEYIIPASKMDSAMQRYGSGMRGSSVIPESANVSVNYSGSTVDMGGTSYINKGDVNGIVSQAVNQTLTTLAKSPRARLGAGLR
nr:Phage tail tape measure protein [uncultured Mediterranean phage uvMED]